MHDFESGFDPLLIGLGIILSTMTGGSYEKNCLFVSGSKEHLFNGTKTIRAVIDIGDMCNCRTNWQKDFLVEESDLDNNSTENSIGR